MFSAPWADLVRALFTIWLRAKVAFGKGVMRVFSRLIGIVACLAFVLQSAGLANSLFACCCVDCGQIGIRHAPEQATLATGCCCTRAIDTETAPCVEDGDSVQTCTTECPCWNSSPERLTAVCPSARSDFQPFSSPLVTIRDLPPKPPAIGQSYDPRSGPAGMAPRLRLQSLLCSWLI